MLATYSRRKSLNLLVKDGSDPERPKFKIFQERSQGRARELPATEATSTVLSSLTTANEFPLLYALKRELQSWRLLHLDPTALREPDSFDGPDSIASNGAHLANTLLRIARETSKPDRPNGILNDLIADLSAVIPEVVDLKITEDEARRRREIEVVTRGEAPFSARVASDGTLRAIALLAALYDPRGSGLICFEEPENGIYPHRLAQFVQHLRHLVQRAFELRTRTPEARVTQLLLSSHSPAILKSLRPSEEDTTLSRVVFIDMSTRSGRSEPLSRTSRVRGVRTTFDEQLSAFEIGSVVSPAEIAEFEVSEALGV
jgi:predicted ATPase